MKKIVFISFVIVLCVTFLSCSYKSNNNMDLNIPSLDSSEVVLQNNTITYYDNNSLLEKQDINKKEDMSNNDGIEYINRETEDNNINEKSSVNENNDNVIKEQGDESIIEDDDKKGDNQENENNLNDGLNYEDNNHFFDYLIGTEIDNENLENLVPEYHLVHRIVRMYFFENKDKDYIYITVSKDDYKTIECVKYYKHVDFEYDNLDDVYQFMELSDALKIVGAPMGTFTSGCLTLSFLSSNGILVTLYLHETEYYVQALVIIPNINNMEDKEYRFFE